MAKVEGGWGENFRGKLDGLSFYKMKGVDKTIIRRSAGHTKDQLKNDPNLEQFRVAGIEFGGRALASRYLMNALKYHKPLADHNIAGPLNALMKSVQNLEPVNEWGKRGIILSDHPHFLKGFSLNRKHPFDSVIRYPVSCVLDRSAMAATVYIPELMPGINFVPPVNLPYYSLRITLGVVPDIIYEGGRYMAVHPDYPEHSITKIDTEWFSLMGGSSDLEIMIKNDFVPPDDSCTLVLTVGIRYGILKDVGIIQQAPYVGSAKILEVG
jgi:hypothetical protein